MSDPLVCDSPSASKLSDGCELADWFLHGIGAGTPARLKRLEPHSGEVR